MELLDFTIDQLSLYPILGGQSARGCGEIAGMFQFFAEDGTLIKNVAIGDFKPARITHFTDPIGEIVQSVQ